MANDSSNMFYFLADTGSQDSACSHGLVLDFLAGEKPWPQPHESPPAQTPLTCYCIHVQAGTAH